MLPQLTLDATELLDTPAAVSEDEFVLDMRVVETTTPLVTMMCSTSDGCGSTCSTSACSTSSNDPA
ncbi:FxLD family lanthipeptide [Actinomadura bangladeshensis]|uniref:FxLD family lantipeptide n=1 Tax=Actinomadura bangladeshensis TaxID=453573 RepID=A0A6L9QI71_9ACTN|nr:FxLD family lanthipeptide [Actinomadura bangladeshensis]NEA23774.1 FxLD family lantipeptide [Actinomadura bangladeshensis]